MQFLRKLGPSPWNSYYRRITALPHPDTPANLAAFEALVRQLEANLARNARLSPKQRSNLRGLANSTARRRRNYHSAQERARAAAARRRANNARAAQALVNRAANEVHTNRRFQNLRGYVNARQQANLNARLRALRGP